MESFSLFELNEYVRRVIALNFPEPVWVHAEISQISESRGQYYLDLIHNDEETGQALAKAQAVIWYRSFLFLKKKLKELLPPLLQSGVEIRMKVKIEFHERYGLKFNIEDIDPAFTLGKLEIQRQKIIQRLTDNGWLHANHLCELPEVIQRIAIISSPNAAGFADFINQLNHNPYQYSFKTSLFETAVQGNLVSKEVSAAFQKINQSDINFDAIVIIRGGGSKLDLAGFDDYLIGEHIGKSTIPVITGIGHETDQTITDLCAKLALKTPTAVANFLIDHNLNFESTIDDLSQSIKKSTNQLLITQQQLLIEVNTQIQAQLNSLLAQRQIQLDHHQQQLRQNAIHCLKNQWQILDTLDQFIKLSDPSEILKKGYAIIKYKGRVLSKETILKKGERLNIFTETKKIDATINEILES